MEFNYKTVSAKEFERSNTIIWGAFIAGCVMISVILFMQGQGPDFYNLENFYTSPFMWISSVMAVGGYFLGNILYQKKVEEGRTLTTLNEKINAFRASFLIKASFLEGPTLVAIIFMMLNRNFYFLMIAAILLLAQFLNRPSNKRFFYEFRLDDAEKQAFLARDKN